MRARIDAKSGAVDKVTARQFAELTSAAFPEDASFDSPRSASARGQVIDPAQDDVAKAPAMPARPAPTHHPRNTEGPATRVTGPST